MLKDFSENKFDVIVLAGQSNAEGYGFGPVEDPYQPDGRVWYLNPDMTVVPAAEKVTGNEIQSNFGLSFAREYRNGGCLADDRDLLILRCAVGGTGFSDKRWGLADDLYLRMLEMIRTALELNPENRLKAFLWHQGETDACAGMGHDEYFSNLMTLIRSVREEFGVPCLPFIAGDFVQHWKNDNIGISAPVADAVRDVCAACGFGAFVETDGLLSNRQELNRNPLGWLDTIHFSRKAVYELGRRYFEAYRSGVN